MEHRISISKLLITSGYMSEIGKPKVINLGKI